MRVRARHLHPGSRGSLSPLRRGREHPIDPEEGCVLHALARLGAAAGATGRGFDASF